MSGRARPGALAQSIAIRVPRVRTNDIATQTTRRESAIAGIGSLAVQEKFYDIRNEMGRNHEGMYIGEVSFSYWGGWQTMLWWQQPGK
jgi:hypothetical protein